MRTVVVGLGLIGGSMAIDLRRTGIATQLIGVDEDEGHARKAMELGLVDEVTTLNRSLKDADLVILAIPVSAITRILVPVMDQIAPNTIVLDTGSTKASICKAIASHSKRRQFVAAHPIAGTENSGPEAALNGLFEKKTMIVCEQDLSSKEALATAEQVFKALQVKTIHMGPVEHDKHVAYVSHLSHVSSFLLGQTVMDIEKDEKNIFDLAGSGFASTVRLAKSSPDMWAPIFEQNVEYLSQALLEYIMHLQRFHYHLMKKDSKEIHRIMTEANEIRRVLSGIELKDQKENKVESLIEK